LPRIEIDYCFLRSDEDFETAVPVLCAVYAKHSYGFARVASHKGRTDVESIGALCAFLDELGLAGPLIIRTDAEPSVEAVAQAVAARRGTAITIRETTPVGSSSGLGAGERWIQALQQQVRCLRSSVQQRFGSRPVAGRVLFGAMVSHSAGFCIGIRL